MKKYFISFLLIQLLICCKHPLCAQTTEHITVYFHKNYAHNESYCISLNTNGDLTVLETSGTGCGNKKVNYEVLINERNKAEANSRIGKLLAQKGVSDPIFTSKVVGQILSIIGQVVTKTYKPQKIN